jgi:hypothetical protein
VRRRSESSERIFARSFSVADRCYKLAKLRHSQSAFTYRPENPHAVCDFTLRGLSFRGFGVQLQDAFGCKPICGGNFTPLSDFDVNFRFSL